MKLIHFLLAATIAVASSISDSASAQPARRELAALTGASGWLNSPPLTADELRGKVVVVDFWTYSCINWMRTVPYLRSWAEKYKSAGLVLIGVHTPEFEFEKDAENVRRFLQEAKIDFRVVQDNDYAIWRAFANNAWPALYVIDAQGRMRHHQAGENDYEMADKAIQKLLAAAGASGVTGDVAPVAGRGLEAAADWKSLRTPETYVGHARAENFASPSGAVADQAYDYTAPRNLMLNHWALSGNWTVKREFAALNKPDGRIAFRFHARDVHLVMGPAMKGAKVRFRVLIDGKPPRGDHGIDVDDDGMGTIAEPRLYQLIRQRAAIDDRLFEIEFLDPGVQAYAFTFG